MTDAPKTYTVADAREFAEIAHETSFGDMALAWCASQAFYNMTREQPDAQALHDAFRARIVELDRVKPSPRFNA